MSTEYAHDIVPEHAASRPAGSIALIISSAVMGVPCIILGASIGHDYGIARALMVIVLGCGATAVLAAAAAYAGVRSRRSAALLAKQTFGVRGSVVLNAAMAVALLGWFAVEMGFIGDMIAAGLKASFGVSIGRVPGTLLAGVVVCLITIRGIAVISRAPLVFLPLLVLLLSCVLFLTVRSLGATPLAMTPKALGSGVSAIIGSYIAGCLIMPDYSRFVRSGRAAMSATALALGPVYGLVLCTYALAAIATGQTLPTGILDGLGLPAVIGFVLPIGLLQNGVMCLYSSSLATSQLVPSAPVKTVAILLAVIGAGLAFSGASAFFVSFLVVLGIVFPPALALLICTGLDPSMRREGERTRPWSASRLITWSAGVASAISSEWLGFGLTGFSAIDGFIVAAAGGLLLVRIAARQSERIVVEA
ncbi:purine-cytosine permease family protein [Sphingomonas paucimobilis]|uniref:Cytosine permease n=1 Tax=Sphingomonas paucimobilis TaxID=13689 RepID=A0A7Y2KTJ0_SPHPI|nr:cytosine permease [Sphingomonas paucimobilis]NNG58591.1 hypothetical protein [Sphingomonas paucimobilis]